MPRRPANVHRAYHAHVYFDAQTVAQARALCEEAGRSFDVQVGPHPRWSCQLAFSACEFDRLIPWLDAHRGGLDIFVHGLTGNELQDHTAHASWLGDEHALDLSVFGA